MGEKIEYNYEQKYDEWEKDSESEPWRKPSDDIMVETIPNNSRLAENPVPQELQNRKSHSVKPYIHECIDFFSADHIRVQRKNIDKTTVRNVPLQKRIEALLEKKHYSTPDSQAPLTQTQQIFLDPNEIPKPEGVNVQLIENCSEGTNSILVCSSFTIFMIVFLLLGRKKDVFPCFMRMLIHKSFYQRSQQTFYFLLTHRLKLLSSLLNQDRFPLI